MNRFKPTVMMLLGPLTTRDGGLQNIKIQKRYIQATELLMPETKPHELQIREKASDNLNTREIKRFFKANGSRALQSKCTYLKLNS